ncbi:MAG: beta-glucosidase, partial [Chitinophagaceae bacterium]
VIDGLKSVGGSGVNILYAKGANITDDTALAKMANVFGEKVSIDSRTPAQMIEEAVALAASADVVVAVLGEASEFSGEAASRTDIGLPASQKRLLEALTKTGKPVVLVLMSGRPLTIADEMDQATAVLQAWFAGHEAGNAIADVLFGAYNPSGKLTMSFPRNVGQVPIYYNHKRTGRPQAEGAPTQKFRSNYLDVANSPLLPFGYGLSYTSFDYSDIKLNSNTVTAKQPITATVKVTNTGNFDGEEVVQLYIWDQVASVTQPVKKLKGFQKIFLKKGESRDVTFRITTEELKFFNSDLKWVAEPGAFTLYIGTSSADLKEAKFTLK